MLNKKMFRLVSFFSVLVLAVVVLGSSPDSAYANTCTFVGDGDWHTIGNWSGCGGILPQAADSVVIPTGSVVTMSGSSTITALTFNDAVAAANSLALTGNTLTVSGATTYTATTGAAGSSIAVGTGTFSTDTLVISDGAAAGNMVLSVSTGTITVTGDVSGTWTDAAQVQFTSTGDSDMNFGGHFPSGATLDGTGGRITFNSADAQNIGAYTTYNNVTKSGAGTATLLGATTFGGTLTLTAGTIATNTQTFTVTGASSITGTITFSTGVKTFTGNVTLNSGAVWDGSIGAGTYTIGGDWTNNATTFTASTGLHTFNGATTKTIGGTTATIIPSVTIVTGNHSVDASSTLML
ncbi:MAG: hypothetical protein UU10_C0016G0011 [Parcubacteria group bacterium GW2011_GWF1_40_6]|nr:MAG: hypothetical protein UU10_C0016G0011 [Parcubacteria group bacterium GW2011_GWF1_40_6]